MANQHIAYLSKCFTSLILAGWSLNSLFKYCILVLMCGLCHICVILPIFAWCRNLALTSTWHNLEARQLLTVDGHRQHSYISADVSIPYMELSYDGHKLLCQADSSINYDIPP